MRLPLADGAVLPREKIKQYLLSLDHPVGRFKARFFLRFGFTADAWEALAKALKDHALTHDVAEVVDSAFGSKYIVEGALDTPGTARPRIRVVWHMGHGSSAPRLVTAYPC